MGTIYKNVIIALLTIIAVNSFNFSNDNAYVVSYKCENGSIWSVNLYTDNKHNLNWMVRTINNHPWDEETRCVITNILH